MRKQKVRINILSDGVRPGLELPLELLPVSLGMICFFYMLSSGVSLALSEKNKTALSNELINKNRSLSTQIQALTDRNRIWDRQDERFNSLQKVIDRKSYWSDAFKELSALVPDGLWLTSLSHSPENPSKRLVLKGEAVSQTLVADLYSKLEKSQNFSGAIMNFSERDADVRPSRYQFEFVIPAGGMAFTPDAPVKPETQKVGG